MCHPVNKIIIARQELDKLFKLYPENDINIGVRYYIAEAQNELTKAVRLEQQKIADLNNGMRLQGLANEH